MTDTSKGAKFRVAITGDFEGLAMKSAPWSKLDADVEVVAFPNPFFSAQETVAALRDFDAVTLMHGRVALSREILEQLPRLKLVISSGRKTETLDVDAAEARHIIICKSNPNFEEPVDAPGGRSPAELAVGLMLGCTWRIGTMTKLIRDGGWAAHPGIPLRGKTLGILGYGALGKPVARVGLALGMRVLAFSRSLSAEAASADNVTRADLNTLVKEADVISIHLPLNAQTRGLIGAGQIAQMKNGVILINTARAAIVDEQPFLQALSGGKIAMAGLDVFWEEPLPADHPLKKMPNVVMTPHLGYVTEESMIVRYIGLFETLAAYRKGNIVGRLGKK